MKKLILAASFLAVSFAPSLAADPVVPDSTPVAVDPARFDWTGAYVGAVISKNYGVDDDGGVDYDLEPALQKGLLLGYNHQMGDFVVGGEVSAHFGKVHEDGYSNYYFDRYIDLKLRAGIVFDRLLVFGTIGKSLGSGEYGQGDDWKPKGINYGAGLDYALTNNWIAGLEFVHRETRGDDAGGGWAASSINSFQGSIKYKF